MDFTNTLGGYAFKGICILKASVKHTVHSLPGLRLGNVLNTQKRLAGSFTHTCLQGDTQVIIPQSCSVQFKWSVSLI